MSRSPAPAPRTRKTRKPRPKPGPIRALGDIDHYPSRDRPIPANISCREICQRYPNHLRDEVLEDFIYWKWSARQIFDALAPDAQVQMSQNHDATNKNRNPSNVLAKRLEKRRARYIRAGGLDQIMNRQNVRPHGMGPSWRGIHRDAAQEHRLATMGREDTPHCAVTPITPAASTAGLPNPAEPASRNGFGFIGDVGLQQPPIANPVPDLLASDEFNFNDPITRGYQVHDGHFRRRNNFEAFPPPYPPTPVSHTYDQQATYGITDQGQAGDFEVDAPGTWNGDNGYVNAISRDNLAPNDAYGDAVSWPNDTDGTVPSLPEGYEYFGPNQPAPAYYDDYEYPDPGSAHQAAPAYQQYDHYPDLRIASEVDQIAHEFVIYADPPSAPQANLRFYQHSDPAQDQENLSYLDGVDSGFNGYDGSANDNEHWGFEDDQY